MREGVLLSPGCSDSASFGRLAIEAEREGTSIFTNQHNAHTKGKGSQVCHVPFQGESSVSILGENYFRRLRQCADFDKVTYIFTHLYSTQISVLAERRRTELRDPSPATPPTPRPINSKYLHIHLPVSPKETQLSIIPYFNTLYKYIPYDYGPRSSHSDQNPLSQSLL